MFTTVRTRKRSKWLAHCESLKMARAFPSDHHGTTHASDSPTLSVIRGNKYFYASSLPSEAWGVARLHYFYSNKWNTSSLNDRVLKYLSLSAIISIWEPVALLFNFVCTPLFYRTKNKYLDLSTCIDVVDIVGDARENVTNFSFLCDRMCDGSPIILIRWESKR